MVKGDDEPATGHVDRLVAFGVSSVIWLVGFNVAADQNFPTATAEVSPIAIAVFLFVTTAVVGLAARAWLGGLLVLAWMAGVALILVQQLASDAGNGFEDRYGWIGLSAPLILAIIYLTAPFVAWVATAGAIWVLIADRDRD